MKDYHRELIAIARQIENLEAADMERDAGLWDTLKHVGQSMKSFWEDAKKEGDKDERQRNIDEIGNVAGALQTLLNKANALIAYVLLGNAKQVNVYVDRITDANIKKDINDVFAGIFDKAKATGITDALKKEGVRDPKGVIEFFTEKGINGKFDQVVKGFKTPVQTLLNQTNNIKKDLEKQQVDGVEEGFDYVKALDGLK